ncbi:MAG: hypothetical protein M9894_32215 [Planctomycetes bacterium]|nr:hypothetical protein [Planctomycetota bacterium]
MARRSRERRLKVGDLVRFQLGAREVVAEVVEDYGGIGVGGRQLVSVARATEDGGRERFDVAAPDVTLERRRSSRRGA